MAARNSYAGRAEQSTRDPIRVVLIDDSRLARDLLASLLDGQPSFKVVATAASATTGLARVQDTKPDVALLDARLCNGDTRLCLQSIKQVGPETGVILTDVPPVLQAIIAFIKAGANGFLLRDATAADVVATVRSVARGTDIVPARLASELVSYIADHTVTTPPLGALPRAAGMTERERQITALIAEGMSNKEIAQRLNIALYTVKSHVHNLLEKSALHSRLQLAAYAPQGRTAGPHSPDREASGRMEKAG